MAIMPNEFPVVLTIFLALGAWRISQQHVLTRRIPAVETLGAATVLCVDKTGTLTLNRMYVKQLYASGQFYEVQEAQTPEQLPAQFHTLLEYGSWPAHPTPSIPWKKRLWSSGRAGRKPSVSGTAP